MVNKYIRGSIWWIELPKLDGYTSVQYGKRPCIVVSNNINNLHSKAVNIVPCSTSADELDVIHPHFTMYGTTNYILCEQIRTVDIKDLFGYMGVLEKEDLQALDSALMKQLGLLSNPSMDIIAQLEAINVALNRIEDVKKEEVKVSIENDVKLKQKIDNLHSRISQIDKFNNKLKKCEELNKPKAKVEKPIIKDTVKKPRMKWTEDKILELLTDADLINDGKLQYEDILDKYLFKDRKAAQTYIGRYRRQYNGTNLS